MGFQINKRTAADRNVDEWLERYRWVEDRSPARKRLEDDSPATELLGASVITSLFD